MDGVLIDAKEWHYEALNQALGLFGSPISREDHLLLYDGLPTAVKLQELTNRGFLPSQLHLFVNELKQLYLNQVLMVIHQLYVVKYNQYIGYLVYY
jgi:beta-phosphoglucomutase-like phosphatase (HAD superfamily)